MKQHLDPAPRVVTDCRWTLANEIAAIAATAPEFVQECGDGGAGVLDYAIDATSVVRRRLYLNPASASPAWRASRACRRGMCQPACHGRAQEESQASPDFRVREPAAASVPPVAAVGAVGAPASVPVESAASPDSRVHEPAADSVPPVPQAGPPA